MVFITQKSSFSRMCHISFKIFHEMSKTKVEIAHIECHSDPKLSWFEQDNIQQVRYHM